MTRRRIQSRRFSKRFEALVAVATTVAAREDVRWQKRRRVFDSLQIMPFVFRLVVAQPQDEPLGFAIPNCYETGRFAPRNASGPSTYFEGCCKPILSACLNFIAISPNAACPCRIH